jgi:hypothetical protein
MFYFSAVRTGGLDTFALAGKDSHLGTRREWHKLCVLSLGESEAGDQRPFFSDRAGRGGSPAAQRPPSVAPSGGFRWGESLWLINEPLRISLWKSDS